MRTARRYAASVEDAEDAYQRGIEIMLTKAPDIPDADLLPWLKTVVRHEAFALRRKDDRVVLGAWSGDGDDPAEDDFGSLAPTPAEKAEQFERLRLGAEALHGLKPQEMKALTLVAQGYSYRQICEQTGWTYTKVNRCLAEGRQSFVKRVAGIESGAECERLAPKLSAFADGEAPAADVTVLRRHLRGCLACQTDLRELHLVPAAVGALVPLPFLERVLWPVERLGELAATVKVRLDSFVRIPGFDAASSPAQFAASGGTRGLTSTGLAKALTLLCLGSAGAGGAAAVEKALDPRGPEPARASSASSDDSARPSIAGLTSPDPRLMAERLRAPDGIPRDTTASDSLDSQTSRGSSHRAAQVEPADELRTPRNQPTAVSSPANASPPEGHSERTDTAAPSKSDSSCSEARYPDYPYEPAGETGPDQYQPAGESRESGDSYGLGFRRPPEDNYGHGVGGPDEDSHGLGFRSPPEDNYGHGVGGPPGSGDRQRCDQDAN